MPIADVLAVFCEEAACGILAFLPVVSVKEGGRRFFEVSVAVALAGLVLGEGARAIAGGLGETWRLAALCAAAASLALSVLALRVLKGTGFDRARPVLAASALAALVALGAESALVASRQGALLSLEAFLPRAAIVFASLAAGAALTGSVFLAMVLGHFYLVIPRLSIDPLRRLTNGYLASVLARIAIAGLVVALARNAEASPGRSVFLEDATVLLPRALFGLVGPLVLCLLARGTVAIKSTQSATGILYGATVFVVFGELAASWLAVERGLPL